MLRTLRPRVTRRLLSALVALLLLQSAGGSAGATEELRGRVLARSPAAGGSSSTRGLPSALGTPLRTAGPEVLARLKRDAKGGSADAQYQLGLLNYYGEGGMKRDAGSALKLFKDAAVGGLPAACLAMGLMLEAGEEGLLGPDPSAAHAYFRLGMEGDDSEAPFRAGLQLYEERLRGYDEHERLADAFDLFKIAVERRHRGAMFYLGVMLEYGLHAPQNFTAAAGLYGRCCERGPAGPGDPDCCFHVGLLHAYGRGTPQDAAAARDTFKMCLLVSAEAGTVGRGTPVHGPCALYLGRLHLSGEGLGGVDYDAARVYLQQARDSGDPRATAEAGEAFERLDGLMHESEEGTARMLQELEADRALPPPVGGRARA
jgi:TPR repeat protein